LIVRLVGTVQEVTEDSVIIERDGIAREVLIPPFAVGELVACRGREVTIQTVEFLEGNQASGQLVPRMLGFLHPEDKLFFSRFIGVKGIGPRKGLRALDEPVRRIASWIESGDTKALARLPGIGKRAAELIVATLRGKVADLAIGAEGEVPESARLTRTQHDALEIMVQLGDPRVDAVRWLERAAQLHPDVETVEAWMRAAYKVKTGVEE